MKKKVWIIQDKWRWKNIAGFETKKNATIWLREYLAVNTMKDKSDFKGPVKIERGTNEIHCKNRT